MGAWHHIWCIPLVLVVGFALGWVARGAIRGGGSPR